MSTDPDQETPQLNKHNRTGYVRGCRCETCSLANREYQRKYMQQWRAAANKSE